MHPCLGTKIPSISFERLVHTWLTSDSGSEWYGWQSSLPVLISKHVKSMVAPYFLKRLAMPLYASFCRGGPGFRVQQQQTLLNDQDCIYIYIYIYIFI